MTLGPDAVMQVLLRERVRIAAAAVAVVRDVHAADDVFQQVVLEALEHCVTFRDPGHVLAWALRSARHRAVDRVRRTRLRYLPDDVLDLIEVGWGEPAGPGRVDPADALHECMDRMAAPARELLRMRYHEGLTAAAIAARLRRTTDAVYQSLSRTHRLLRECVERKLAVENPTTANEGGT